MSVSNIPAGAPFVDTLAAGLLARHGSAGDSLADLTVLLPTRRACLTLREAFLRLSDGDAMLLPRLMPLGDVDADEVEPDTLGVLSESLADGSDLPPAMPDLERQLILARLVMSWGRHGDGVFARADQAARLAGELARLLDQVQTERLSFDGLATLVPEDYASHWQHTLEFLEIVTRHWPAVLAERGVMDPAARRNRMLESLAARWQASPPDYPVIAAGSTGSIPATADLLAVIAGLPQGEVVLPGLDRLTDDAIWHCIDEGHPQFGLKRLLERMAVDRDQVTPWTPDDTLSSPPGRAALLNMALRPAVTTESWATEPPLPRDVLDGLEAIDCPGPREEAGVIALRLRQALETPGRTAALVTRDRPLARRVAAELGRWGVEVDDSGGQPLADTAPGSFMRLTAAMMTQKAAPVALLAALKHPLTTGGLAPGAFRAQVRLLENAILRGPRPGSGFRGIAHALGRAKKATDDLRRWFDAVAALAAPLADLVDGERVSLGELAAAHLAFAEGLAASNDSAGPAQLWAGDAGEAVAAFFSELIEASQALPPLAGRDYGAMVDTLMEDRVTRPPYGRHPRLHIWGPLEARLQHADVMILGGLNEASWPPDSGADPWLSRPMREAFGLPAPERRIGLAAHDFVQSAAAPVVVLTRAQKVEGGPTVPSRWLSRLYTLLRGWEMADGLAAGENWRGWHGALDTPDAVRPMAPPAPMPPVSARPRRLSVTRIETWRRDPYAIYARHILRLKALDPIDADPGAAVRGNIVHEALEVFVETYPAALPDDAVTVLMDIGARTFADVMDRPGVRAFWWPRFERIARWFLDLERRRRGDLLSVVAEAEGRLELDGPAGPFLLTGKADRIERRADGSVTIIDYKTGGVPGKAEIVHGYAPQLPLEAVIARAGGFEGIEAAPSVDLAYWKLSGGDPAGVEIWPKVDNEVLAEEALEGLRQMIARFDDPATPYHAIPDPAWAPRFNDYAHLARVKEWSDLGAGGTGGAGGSGGDT
jgi:ATP-dependent helicase/nuclease subunit B